MSIKSEALKRLFGAYPGKHSDERERLYMSWADKTDVAIVERVIDFCIGEDSSLPKLSRLYSLSREKVMEQAQDAPEVECWLCDATGLVPGIYKDKQGLWIHGIISSCKCSNGQRKKSKTIPLNIFEHDQRYIDLMKVGKKHETTPWGAIPYFYMELRKVGLMHEGSSETNLHSSINKIIDA